MKAFILTYASISESEEELLAKTDVFKIALNQHAEELKPDIRIITDYFLENLYNRFSQKIVSLRDRLKYDSERVEYPKIEFKGSTVVAALEYLILKGYNEIMIVGDNKVNSAAFRDMVNQDIRNLESKAKIYQYSNGNFNLPVLKISEFIFL